MSPAEQQHQQHGQNQQSLLQVANSGSVESSFRPRAVTAPSMTTKRRKEVNLDYKRKENERREQREIEYANARAGNQDGEYCHDL